MQISPGNKTQKQCELAFACTNSKVWHMNSCSRKCRSAACKLGSHLILTLLCITVGFGVFRFQTELHRKWGWMCHYSMAKSDLALWRQQQYIEQHFSNFSMHTNYPGIFLKVRFLFMGLGKALRFCMCKNILGDSSAMVWGLCFGFQKEKMVLSKEI